mmetsp:Transcript_9207/g.13959  ORF Transcript_9207/g.13959 Transcript_9207/m.13959 type:complete len:234 (+) Transcript_9207:4295-4996(+)
MMSEHGGLEKKIERIQEDRDRLKDDIDQIKQERDRKIEEMKRQFDREKEILKQKNNELQNKCKTVEAKQTELILNHETNRAKWDQEKSYLLSSKEDSQSELKSFQRKYESSVKDLERLKEQSKRNNWRQNKQQANPLLHKMGEGVLNRLNLGGAGAGLNRQGGDLSQSQNLNLGGNKEGGIGTYRSNLGVDKSMDNFKMGFGQQFGSQLGQPNLGQSKLGGFGTAFGSNTGAA